MDVHGILIDFFKTGLLQRVAQWHDVTMSPIVFRGRQLTAYNFTLKCIIVPREKKSLKNFVVGICGCKQDWTPDSFIETTVADLKD